MEKKASAKKTKKTPAKKLPEEHKKKDFLVVGLGASAGGVKALQEFFATMPPNSGMAFVAILHLSPEHESNLPQILQAQTAMKVTQVTEIVEVEPNNVYVIPPNVQLEMVDGVIRPSTAERPTGHRIAIDVFFRTLAEAYERNAVCVVLSGTGSDGTLGLKRVKESNGFAIVQDPEDAEYDSMPRSAINTQLADWVLPVHKMPEKLIHFKESSERLHLTNGADAKKIADEIHADESLREILTLLRVRTGHDFSNYKTPTLVRRIARHLQIHELEDIPSYLELLRNHPNELQSLLKNLLINVTNFFRDSEAFEAVEAEIVPDLFDGKTGKDTVRVWSAGCASGEEAFSLAMILTESADRIADPPKIQVFASDVDDEAIAEAREHRYPESIEADVSPERLKRFFTKEGAFYRVKKELRETILFASHNVLRDPPFSRLDMISCRNLLIYLNRDTQERVLQIFHFALNSHGYLFLGNSETAESSAAMFSPVNKKQRLYSRRSVPVTAQTSLPMMPVAGRWEIRLPEKKAGMVRDHVTTLGEIHHKLLENYAPPSVLVNKDFDIVYLSETANRFLRFSGGEPSSSILKSVVPDLLPDLRAALFNAQREHRPAEFPNIRVRIGDEDVTIDLIVRAVDIHDEASDFLLVIFEEKRFPAARRETDRESQKISDKDEAMEKVVRRLEEDLQRTKEHLRSTIEQHETTVEEQKSSNEELQAINEELRSASEELETGKEELQSLNEELTTVNSELKEKIDEAARVNSDLHNIIQSTEIATIFLDKQLRIKRYTPPIEQFFNITSHDVGRPLEHFTHRLNFEKISNEAIKVLQTLKPVERETVDEDGNVFMARFLPYRTIDDRIEGVVLNFIDITARKRAEQTQRESEERFQLFFAATTEILYRMSADWSRMLSLVGKGFLADTKDTRLTWVEEYIPEQDRKLTKTAIDRAVRTGQTFELEHRVIRADGSVGWVFSRAIPLLNASGKIVEWFGSASDITGRKETDLRLREAEARTRLTLDAAGLAMWEWNIETGEIIWSEQYFQMFGMKPHKKTMTTDDFFRHVHPDFREYVAAGLKKAVEEKIPFDVEFCAVLTGGETRWMSSYGRVTETGAKGETTRMSGVMFDINERKTAAEKLRKSEEQLHLIFESTKDYSIITFDTKGLITRWNAGAEKMFGWTEDEMLGKTGSVLFTPEDRVKKVPEREFETALEKGRAEDERWHVRKDGSRFFASGVTQPLRDGTLEGFVKIARDQTERIEAEKILREQEMLRQFVRTQEDERQRIARDIHDQFGQQLTALRFKIHGLKKLCAEMDIPGKEKAAAQVDDLQKTSEQLDRDVDFLAWELRPSSLEDLGLRLTLQNFVKEWSGYTGVQAEFHTSGIGKIHLTDEIETNLYRIAQESLNNINKHAKATAVSVLLEKRRDMIVLIVEDDGVGFDPAKKRKGARELGLVGIRERARILGGETEIESEKGKGTTIYVRVPVKTINSRK